MDGVLFPARLLGVDEVGVPIPLEAGPPSCLASYTSSSICNERERGSSSVCGSSKTRSALSNLLLAILPCLGGRVAGVVGMGVSGLVVVRVCVCVCVGSVVVVVLVGWPWWSRWQHWSRRHSVLDGRSRCTSMGLTEYLSVARFPRTRLCQTPKPLEQSGRTSVA